MKKRLLIVLAILAAGVGHLVRLASSPTTWANVTAVLGVTFVTLGVTALASWAVGQIVLGLFFLFAAANWSRSN